MKLSKIFLLAGVVFAFASCSDDGEWNTTSEATVSMASEALTVSEAAGMFNIPFVVSGERNAPVQVTFEVTPFEGSDKLDPAIADVNYLLTSNIINVAEDSENGSLEAIAVDDGKVNERNRAFVVKIISVKGGTFDAAKSSTVVTLKDPSPYEALAGKWAITYNDYYNNGAATKGVLTVTAAPEGSENYNKFLTVSGWGGQDGLSARMSYNFDPATQKISLSLITGEKTGALNFSGIGLADVILFNVVDGQATDTPLVGTLSEDSKTIDFGNCDLYGGVYVGGQGLGGFFRWQVLKMTR